MIKSFSSSIGNDIVKEFIQPELNGAEKYYRSTGHFSSSFLVSAAEAFSQFFNSKKEMKVICCQELNKRDMELIKSGNDPSTILYQNLMDSIEDLSDKIEYIKTNNIEVLYWLIKTGQFEIRLCVKKEGIFHEKYGLIYRPDRNCCFIGGFNLSMSGHLFNSEACVATDDPDTFKTWENTFLTTWEGHSLTTKCYPFPEAAKHVILKNFENEWIKRCHNPITSGINESHLFDSLWDHQKRGYECFFNNGMQGILQMATGTGKTRLALAIYEKLFSAYKVNYCILVASRSTLLDQWIQDLRKYFPKHGIIRRYGKYNELGDFQLYLDGKRPAFLLSSYSLFSDSEKSTRDIKDQALIICDEVHNLGADTCERDLRGLISPYKYRLGLSATPSREYDEDGTTFIQGEIGNVIFQYPLEDALRDRVLCPFNYAPIEYSLSDDERSKINNLVKKKNAKNADGTSVMTDSEFARLVSDVIKRSRNKLEPFEKFLEKHPTVLNRSISFVFDKEYGIEVQKIIRRFDPDFKYHTFYDDDPDDHLDRFSGGGLNCLITCNKISEGISINDIATVILFSASRSSTETLQRIGRCLRIDPNNPEKIALIVDFVEIDRVSREGTADYDRYSYLSGLCNELIK